MPEDLLPSPAQVRCRLAVDLPIQIRLLIAESGLVDIDEAKFTESVINARDRSVISRIQEIIPKGEIDRASSASGLDIEVLVERLPFVFAIWVYESALTINEAAVIVSNIVESRKADQDST